MTTKFKFPVGPLCEFQAMNPKRIVVLIDTVNLHIVQVAVDSLPHREALQAAHPGALLVFGDIAVLFYRAVAGRSYDQPPEASRLTVAQLARWELSKQRYSEEAYSPLSTMWDILTQVIERHYPGQNVNPWLGTTRLDERGRILTYNRRSDG